MDKTQTIYSRTDVNISDMGTSASANDQPPDWPARNPERVTYDPPFPPRSSNPPFHARTIETRDFHASNPLQPIRLQAGPKPQVRAAENPKPVAGNKDLLVVAIDFGMTFTGYAFGFQHDISKVFTATADGKLAEDRVPTTVLLKPDKSFHSFGHVAEEDYAALVKDGKHKDWMYFEQFKMELYTNASIKRDTPVTDKDGHKMPAILIFSMVIRHLKDLVEVHVRNMRSRDYKWLITIPAIWSDAARQFMREAAKNAGIDENKIHLTLEPEAAAVYCMEQAAQWQQRYFDKNNQVTEFTTGFKYILADIGGGTADICVHEIIEGGHIREIVSASGDALGGTYVNQEFLQFLQKLFGANLISQIKKKQLKCYLDLIKDFERKKKTFCKATTDIKFSLEPQFPGLVESETGETLEQAIQGSTYCDKVKFQPSTNKLTITSEVVKGFFKTSVQGIVKKLKDIVSETNDENLKTLILVGGYSESPYLKEVIESEFKNLTVLQEADAKLAVLKGAVMSGFKPRMIMERRAQFTYGYYMIERFDPSKHPQELKICIGGEYFCDKIFLKQIEKGQILTFGQATTYKSVNKVETDVGKRQPFLIRFVRSTKKDPKFCTEEEGCKVIDNGKISAYPPRTGWPDLTNLVLHLIVGETEFIVNVFDQTTGGCFECEISFL